MGNVEAFDKDMTGKTVIVIGGGAVGLDVVEFFAPRGAKTTSLKCFQQSETGWTLLLLPA